MQGHGGLGAACATTSNIYFFAGGGGTWQVECQSTADRAKRVADACDGVVRSIEFR